MHNAVRDLHHIHAAVIADDPGFTALACRLCVDLEEVRTEPAELVWSRIWPLPLYSNVRVAVASKRVDAVRAEGLYCDFRALSKGSSDSQSPWYIEKYRGQEPTARGSEARHLREGTGRIAQHGIRIPARFQLRVYRLAALVESAANPERRGADAFLDRFLAVDSSRSLLAQLPLIKQRLANAVGAVTALHILMDLGIPGIVKPDIWMVRIPQAMGALHRIDVAKYSKGDLVEVLKVSQGLQPLAAELDALLPTKNPLRALDLLLARYGHHRLGPIGTEPGGAPVAGCSGRFSAIA